MMEAIPFRKSKQKVAARMGLKVLAFNLERIKTPLVQLMMDIKRASRGWRVRLFGREEYVQCAVVLIIVSSDYR